MNTLKYIKDGAVRTVWRGSKGSKITIKSKAAIKAVYILWEKNVEPFTIRVPGNNNDTVKGGYDGFLSEFVSIKTAAHTLTLTFDKSSVAIADIYVFGTGAIPSWVQRWKPMLKKADLLVLSAHSDDEFLWFGGTIPVYAGEYHKIVQVAYLVHHGKMRNQYYRNHELLDGLWKAGVTNYPMISNFEDYYTKNLSDATKYLGKDAVLRYSVMLLRRFKPDVVVTHDVNGEYGHGAHRLCAYAIQNSILLSGNPKVYPDIAKQYGVWKIKKCYLHLYPKNSIEMNWYKPLKAFGGKTGLDMAKLCYYDCYVSQCSKKGAWKVAERGTKYDSCKFGLYYSSVGRDVKKNDFFEHIAPVIQ